MKKDNAVIDILSNPKLHFLFEYLKTSNWKKLNESQKEKIYLKINSAVCDALKIDLLDLVVGNGEISEDSGLTNYDYKNLVIDLDQRPLINDVNYNQYLTLYEYFFRVRMELLQLSYIGEYSAFFSEEKAAKIAKNFENEQLGGVSLKVDKDDLEEYEDYQFINKEAREFAEAIMFKVVRDNYDFNDGYDEEKFMSNYNVLVSDRVNEIGEIYLNDHIVDMNKYIYKLRSIKSKLNRLAEGDLSSVDNGDLLFIVYPSIIHNSETVVVLNSFNEIIRRIYKEDFKITWNNDSIVINKHSYSIKDIDNLFNIVLYECLNDMNVTLRNELNEKELINYKKKWLLSVVRLIDASVPKEDFGVFKYHSIYRLLNKEKLNDIVSNTNMNYLPLQKRRDR